MDVAAYPHLVKKKDKEEMRKHYAVIAYPNGDPAKKSLKVIGPEDFNREVNNVK